LIVAPVAGNEVLSSNSKGGRFARLVSVTDEDVNSNGKNAKRWSRLAN
jgi:hypothetical protein